jgi:hypothetical protein
MGFSQSLIEDIQMKFTQQEKEVSLIRIRRDNTLPRYSHARKTS